MPLLKTCFKCGQSLPIDEFYAHPMMADGRLGKCKTCTKKDVSARYRLAINERRAYERERNMRPSRRFNKLKYQRQTRKNDPVRTKAWRMVSYAIQNGRLIRKPCEICGNQKSEAHHHDYSKPLDVRWLCFKHHRQIGHGQLREVV